MLTVCKRAPSVVAELWSSYRTEPTLLVTCTMRKCMQDTAVGCMKSCRKRPRRWGCAGLTFEGGESCRRQSHATTDMASYCRCQFH